MIDFSIKKSFGLAFPIVTGIFTFVPEDIFCGYEWVKQETLEKCNFIGQYEAQDINIIISRLICFFIIWVIASLFYVGILIFRRRVTIKGSNYTISVEYGNIHQKKKCKRVINFDECFTTHVGNAIADINPKSVCGQYLSLHPDLDIESLIEDANVKPSRSKSKYQSKIRYDSGTIVPNGDDLLMAFAKLDEKGKGRFFSRDEYFACLDLLWKEIENYYSEKDVCIPILGAGTTSIDGAEGAGYSQQELLDMIILSYKLCSHKIKDPHKLRIICKKAKGFSINNIGK